jgi:hypothetical protein
MLRDGGDRVKDGLPRLPPPRMAREPELGYKI